MRLVLSLVVAILIFASSADASVIWLYKELEIVAGTASMTRNGVTTFESQHASGAILGDPLTSMIGAGAEIRDEFNQPIAGGGAAITKQSDGLIEFGLSTYGLGCERDFCSSGSVLGFMDLVFRPSDQAALAFHYFPTSGTVRTRLTNLTTGSVVYDTTKTVVNERFAFEFSDSALYRLAAYGEATSPIGGGDPYADFSLRFYDRVTDQAAEVAPVPEPTTLLLLGSGVGGLIVRRRKLTRLGTSAGPRG